MSSDLNESNGVNLEPSGNPELANQIKEFGSEAIGNFSDAVGEIWSHGFEYIIALLIITVLIKIVIIDHFRKEGGILNYAIALVITVALSFFWISQVTHALA